MRRASRELQIPKSTISKVLRKRLHFHPYKLQFVQKLKPEDHPRRQQFCLDLQQLLENDDNLLSKIIFSDEATFHLHGKVNRYNVRIWDQRIPTPRWRYNVILLSVMCFVPYRNGEFMVLFSLKVKLCPATITWICYGTG